MPLVSSLYGYSPGLIWGVVPSCLIYADHPTQVMSESKLAVNTTVDTLGKSHGRYWN